MLESYMPRRVIGLRSAAPVLACTTVALSLAGIARGADTDPGDAGGGAKLEEVVVSAERRSANVQSVPITVDVISESALQAGGITDTSSLNGKVPALIVAENGPGNQYFIRGVGSIIGAPNAEQSVATYIDGVYLYSPFGNIFPIGADIDRIEVLKGPQGTLFGRNATAGVLQFVTKDPKQDPGAEASVGYGNYNTVTGEFYATTGITDTLAADLSVYEKHMGYGYGRNIYNGESIYRTRETSAKTKWLWTPLDGTEVRASYFFAKVANSGDAQMVPQGHPQLDGKISVTPPLSTNANWPNNWQGTSSLWSLQIDQNVGFASVQNIASYRTVSPASYNLDDDNTPSPLVNAHAEYPSHVVTEELRLLSLKNSPVNWVAGIYYLNATVNDNLDLDGTFIAPPPQHIYEFDAHRTKSWAPYAQATVPLIWDSELTGGVRYNHEEIDHFGTRVESPLGTVIGEPNNDSKVYHNISWRGSLDHKWTPSLMTYLSANRSFKSGGFNVVGTGAPSYLPEELTAYEFGVKSELFDRRVRFNASAYYYDYKNIQLQTSVVGTIVTSNGPAAYLKGIDGDFTAAVTDKLTVSGGFNYSNGHFGVFPNAVGYPADPLQGSYLFDATDKSTPYTPKWSATLSADYVIPSSIGEFDLNANASYRGSVFTGLSNRLSMPSNFIENDSVSWTPPNSRFNVRLWVLNAFNKIYYTQLLESGTGDFALWAPPRTYGITVSAKMGSFNK